MLGLMLGRGWNVNNVEFSTLVMWSPCVRHSFRSRVQNRQRSLFSWSLYSSGRTQKVTKTHRICQVKENKSKLEGDRIGCYFRNEHRGKPLCLGNIWAEVTWSMRMIFYFFFFFAKHFVCVCEIYPCCSM